MGDLIPHAALIYERVDGVVYARYRDPPHNTIPRWIVGGDPAFVKHDLLSYSDWKELCELAQKNSILEKQLDKLIVLYYTIKDGNN